MSDRAVVNDFVTKNLPTFLDEFLECNVRSLEDIVDYNERHKDTCMPAGKPT